MSNNNRALIGRISVASWIWLLPLVALLIGAWMIFYTWSQQGPVIEISFDSASGLESGKTKIKTRNLDIGTVKAIRFNSSLSGVIVSAQLSSEATNFLVEDSQFWVVEPRIDASGISGLNTLLSGAYIELAPGRSDVEQDTFVGLTKPPLSPPSAPGMHVTLNSGGRFDFTEGDPLIYNGLEVGKIEDVYFNTSERIVYYNAFIEAPYHELLTSNTRFWSVSGVAVELSASGLRVETGTLSSIINGGIAFGVPDGWQPGKRIEGRDYFNVYPNYNAIFEQENSYAIDYILMFKESINGLNVGAPVQFRGLDIGEVMAVNIAYDTPQNILARDSAIPVRIVLYPAQMGLSDDDESAKSARHDISRWIKNGLRATIATGNFITQAKQIELDYLSNPDEVTLTEFQSQPVIPVASGSIGQLLANADNLLLEATATIQKFNQAAASADRFIDETTQADLPGALKNTLAEIDRLAGDVQQDSPLQQELIRTFATLDRVLKELQPVLRQISEQPNSLVLGRKTTVDKQPKAKQ